MHSGFPQVIHQQVDAMDVDHALGMPRGENALYSAQICLSRAACLGIGKADGAAAVDISLPREMRTFQSGLENSDPNPILYG